ncbi:MAG: NAD(P)/FAD-dependent oxidoreductase [bacterium]|nr:NAD(P)/FAD-dependent oxidoreductase [bacterium]
MVKEDKFDVAVVGAGPAGMMAAATSAELGSKVILIEKNKQLGKKLLLTGNGRCNITNAEFDLRKLVENYGKDGKFLFHAFFIFGPKEVIKFFNNLEVKTKIENDNKVFPESEKAIDVLNALKRCLLKNKVNISLDSQVSRIIFKDDKIKKLIVGQKEIIAKKYIFCTGGKFYPITGSTGDGFKWANDLGHSVSEPLPALVPIKIKENWVKGLQGLVLKNIKISVLQNNKKYFQEIGDILFTHFGLSGPAILNMSKEIGELLKRGKVTILLDLLPNLNTEDLEKKIQERINQNPKKSVKSLFSEFMPQRIISIIIKNLGIDGDKQINNITKKERKNIVKLLKNIEVTVTELLGFDLAMVTSGGVSLKEIDDKTMKSKIVNNLFFAGEIINIDGRTGGFNLQACWSTGYLAGKSAIN